MVLEVAILNVKPDQEENFELAFGQAQRIISMIPFLRWSTMKWYTKVAIPYNHYRFLLILKDKK